MVLLYRSGAGIDGFVWQTFSADKGETWSQAEKTDLVAARASHSLFRLGDGRLLLTHNASKTVQTPLTMRISADGGKTWGESVVVADAPLPGQGEAAWSRQVSYPSVTAADAGTLVVVWGWRSTASGSTAWPRATF